MPSRRLHSRLKRCLLFCSDRIQLIILLPVFSESLWAVRTGNGQIGISSLRSGLKALSVSVNLAGVHRYMESICWYAECHSNTLWNQGGNADYFVPFQIMSIWKGIF